MKHLNKFYFDGAWVAPIKATPFAMINPATNRQIGEAMLGSAVDVDVAVAAAKRAFPSFSKTDKRRRLALLKKLQDIFSARLEEMAQAITAEMGAPITMSRGAQAACGIEHIKAFIAALKQQPEREILPNTDELIREAIGVCGLITPWNWPINEIAQKVVPALATGATVVLKPSEYTLLSAALFADFVQEAGCPAGVFSLIFGDGPTVGSAIARHPDIAMVSFTGSTRAGIAVTKDAADTVKRVNLELGGKSANLILADADLESRVSASVASCFYNSGQSCNAPARMLVERSCYDQVLAIAKRAYKAQNVGDPAEGGDHIGPLVSKIQYDRVQSMIQLGIDEGARLLVGGLGKPEMLGQGWFVRPTIFADVNNKMRIAREEIFGPVLVVIPFDTEEDAIAIANDSAYGLAAYLQTGDAAQAERVSNALRAGTVTVNGEATSCGSPFGGYKQSGNCREGVSSGSPSIRN